MFLLHSTLSSCILLPFQLENIGDTDVQDFLLAIPTSHYKNLAFIQAVQDSKKAKTDPPPLEITTAVTYDGAPANISFFSIKLSKPLPAGKTSPQLTCSLAFLDQVYPHPPEISQFETQFVLHYDNHYILSPYVVVSQTTTFSFPSSKIESYTPNPPQKLKGSSLVFGPYENVPPLSYSEMKAHYEMKRPISLMISAEREIEVSHWGNVYVTEDYHLTNAGAKLVGSFSR